MIETIKTQARLNYLSIPKERLKVDGILGPKTQKAIDEYYQKYDTDILGELPSYPEEFKYISQRNSKYPNSLCSVASLCMILWGEGFDITADELDNFIDNNEELNEKAISMGFRNLAEQGKIEQITKIMQEVLKMFSLDYLFLYMKYVSIFTIMTEKRLPNIFRRIIFATNLTASGHYVVGNGIMNVNYQNIIEVYDPYGNWYSEYKDANGITYFKIDDFLELLKNDGKSGYARVIVKNSTKELSELYKK